MNKSIHKIITAAMIILIVPDLFAAETNAKEGLGDSYYTIMLIVCIVLFNLIFVPLLFEDENEKVMESAAVPKKSVLSSLKQKLTGSVPMEEEGSLLLPDDFDGIRELDNKVPPWFNILFYGTIVFAAVYLIYYHVFGMGKLPAMEYADEMYEAQLIREEMIRTGAFINENNVVQLSDPESLKKGKDIFSVNCTPCHGIHGEGTVGPNLTDEYWLHGGGVKNVFKTVRYGVPVKGMIAWQTQLNPKKMQEVVSYVLSLQGTAPPNGKIAEGQKYAEPDSSKQNSNTDSLKTDTIK